MRTMPFVIAALIALTIPIASPTGVVAHVDRVETAEPGNRSTECIAVPVREAPFSAEAVTTWHPPANSGRAELRSTSRY